MILGWWLAGCASETLVGAWGGTCGLGATTWGVAFDLAEAPEGVGIAGDGDFEVVQGTVTLDRGDAPLEVAAHGARCLTPEGCVTGTTEVGAGWVSLQADELGDGTRLVFDFVDGIEEDRLRGVCWWGNDAYALGTGAADLARDAGPGAFAGTPVTTADPECPLPTGSCDADWGTCEVDHLSDDAHCGVCGAPCAAGCDQGRCDEAPPPMTMAAGYLEACAVVDRDLWCWPTGPAPVATRVRTGDAVGVALGDSARCALTTAGAVVCDTYGTLGEAVIPPPAWTGVREIAIAQDDLCALFDGGRVACHRLDDGYGREVVPAGAIRVAGTRGGRPTWELAGGALWSRTEFSTNESAWGLDSPWPDTGGPLVDVAWGQYGRWGARVDGTLYTDVGDDGSLTGVARVAAGWDQAAVLTTDGAVHAFSALAGGPVGAVPGVAGAVAVVAGFGTSCALGSDGAITCWDALDPSTSWPVTLAR